MLKKMDLIIHLRILILVCFYESLLTGNLSCSPYPMDKGITRTNEP